MFGCLCLSCVILSDTQSCNPDVHNSSPDLAVHARTHDAGSLLADWGCVASPLEALIWGSILIGKPYCIVCGTKKTKLPENVSQRI